LLSRKEVKFNFGFIPTLNVLSISTIKDFIMFTEDLYNKYGRPVAIKQNLVTFPSHQSPSILTPEFAEYIDDCIEYMEKKKDSMPVVEDPYGTWDAFIKFIKPIGESIRKTTKDKYEARQKFGNWADDFDMRRKTNFVEVFPECTDFYNLCKVL
jgi:hypothetical protein